jgi:hypothetical protein
MGFCLERVPERDELLLGSADTTLPTWIDGHPHRDVAEVPGVVGT